MDQCVNKLRATSRDITPQVWLSSKDGLLTRLKHRCNPIPFRIDIRKRNPSGLSLPHKHIPRCNTMNRAYRHQATIHCSLNRWQDKDRELAHAVHTNPFHRVTNILIRKARLDDIPIGQQINRRIADRRNHFFCFISSKEFS